MFVKKRKITFPCLSVFCSEYEKIYRARIATGAIYRSTSVLSFTWFFFLYGRTYIQLRTHVFSDLAFFPQDIRTYTTNICFFINGNNRLVYMCLYLRAGFRIYNVYLNVYLRVWKERYR